MRKWLYLSPRAKIEKTKGTLFSSTFKVWKNKVPLVFQVFDHGLSYDHSQNLQVFPFDVAYWKRTTLKEALPKFFIMGWATESPIEDRVKDCFVSSMKGYVPSKAVLHWRFLQMKFVFNRSYFSRSFSIKDHPGPKFSWMFLLFSCNLLMSYCKKVRSAPSLRVDN